MGQALDTLRKSRVRVVGKKYSPERLIKFLDILKQVGVLTEAARQAGFSVTSAKYYMAKSANGDAGFMLKWGDVEGPFHELVQIALDTAIENIEACAFRRATGYLEPQVHQGRVQYEIDHDAIALGAEPGSWDAIKKDKSGKPIPVTVEKQSEDLQMFILKARRPEIYGNKSQVDVMHRGGVMVITAPARSSGELEKWAKSVSEEPTDVEFIEIEDEPEAPEVPNE